MPTIELPLTQAGPIITVWIHQSASRLRAIAQAGRSLTLPFVGLGLIDSGASCTCIDHRVIAQLNLTPTGTTSIHTPSTGSSPHQCDCFDVSLWFAEVLPNAKPNVKIHPVHLTLPVICSDFSAQGIHALIGRDVLDQCHFTYDGKNKKFTLVYGP